LYLEGEGVIADAENADLSLVRESIEAAKLNFFINCCVNTPQNPFLLLISERTFGQIVSGPRQTD